MVLVNSWIIFTETVFILLYCLADQKSTLVKRVQKRMDLISLCNVIMHCLCPPGEAATGGGGV